MTIPVHNVRTNPQRADPTKTTLIRRQFIAEITRRMRAIQDAIWQFFEKLDALGLDERPRAITLHSGLEAFGKPDRVVVVDASTLLVNVQPREYEFRTSPQKLKIFRDWLEGQVDGQFLTPETRTGKPWTSKYIESSYKKGKINAYLAAKKAQQFENEGFFNKAQDQFLRDSFAQGEATSKIELLATRTFENMKGLTGAMKQQMNLILAQGLADGKGARAIAKELYQNVDKMTKSRALVIARTEVINAHAEGQLDTFEEMGVDDLGVMAEWSTAGDERVCPICAELEGETFTVQEARGRIPQHPNCRCSWIPGEIIKKKRASNKKPAAKTIAAGGPRKTKKQSKKDILDAAGKLGDIEGYSIVSVIRTAGQQGLSFKETKELLEKAGYSAADQTIRIQLKAGRDNKGTLAPTSILDRLRMGLVPRPPTPGPIPIPPVPPAPPTSAPAPQVPVIAPPQPVAPGLPRFTTPAEYREALLQAADAKAAQSNTSRIKELQNQVDALRKKSLQLQDARYDIASKWGTDIVPQDDPRRVEWKKLYQEQDQVNVEVNRLKEQIKEITTAGSLSRQEAFAFIREQDNLSDKVTFSFDKSSKLKKYHSEKIEEPIREVLSWMPAAKYSNWDVANLGALQAEVRKERGKLGTYRVYENLLQVHSPDATDTIAHEFGHHISYKVLRIMDKQNAFFRKRTANEPTVKLPEYSDVRGKKDRWATGGETSYAGRVYEDGRYPEVIAVGVQRLYKDPVKFARDDPEYFDAILDMLKG